jgi:hypothetical protein
MRKGLLLLEDATALEVELGDDPMAMNYVLRGDSGRRMAEICEPYLVESQLAQPRMRFVEVALSADGKLSAWHIIDAVPKWCRYDRSPNDEVAVSFTAFGRSRMPPFIVRRRRESDD